ncbi:hypothetical protein [Ornithinimicrobium pratense]|uniref:Uncharacterized protein n=1 Tax=Ornithinimicrobium pratense TaxID=2593973 RepID=A0A5J6V6B8_9MICO|nr:hypothetical protein [Ornithinimicrobium pratense]QFG68854.1 hypothetical protein FY030_09210 [Ornithinimicrobium pratense]
MARNIVKAFFSRRPKIVIGELPPPQRAPRDIPKEAVPELTRGERVLAVAQEDASGHWLVLTTYRLLERSSEGLTALERAWHEVDTGTWDPDLWVLSISFTDGLNGRQWQLKTQTGPGEVPQVLRERTTATVVLMRVVDLGPRRTARVTVRKDLATRELDEQVILGRGARSDDAELMASIDRARADVRNQAGMPPV